MVGDGITDDTLAINAAINYVAYAGYDALVFSEGTYVVSNQLRLRSHVSMISTGATLKVADSCTGYFSIFHMRNVANITISGFHIDGNASRAAYDIALRPEIAFYMTNVHDIHIEDNTMDVCGIWAMTAEVSPLLPYSDHIYVERNTINYTVGKNSATPLPTGFTVDTTQIYIDAKDFWICDNTIVTADITAETAIEAHRKNGLVENNTIDGFTNGILVVPGQYAETDDITNITVVNNTISNARKGITLWQFPERDIDGAVISDNSIHLSPERFPNTREAKGVLILPTLPTDNDSSIIRDVLIERNEIVFEPTSIAYEDSDATADFVGIGLRSWVSVEDITVRLNTILNAPATGILIGSQGNATYPNTSSGFLVEENTITNAGYNVNIAAESYNPRCAIRINGNEVSDITDSIVRNNSIIDTRVGGTYFTTPVHMSQYDALTCVVEDNSIDAFGYV